MIGELLAANRRVIVPSAFKAQLQLICLCQFLIDSRVLLGQLITAAMSKMSGREAGSINKMFDANSGNGYYQSSRGSPSPVFLCFYFKRK